MGFRALQRVGSAWPSTFRSLLFASSLALSVGLLACGNSDDSSDPTGPTGPTGAAGAGGDTSG